jgi:hypothetical protein
MKVNNVDAGYYVNQNYQPGLSWEIGSGVIIFENVAIDFNVASLNMKTSRAESSGATELKGIRLNPNIQYHFRIFPRLYGFIGIGGGIYWLKLTEKEKVFFDQKIVEIQSKTITPKSFITSFGLQLKLLNSVFVVAQAEYSFLGTQNFPVPDTRIVTITLDQDTIIVKLAHDDIVDLNSFCINLGIQYILPF